jgi:Ca2+-binding RTX toxin-like protein
MRHPSFRRTAVLVVLLGALVVPAASAQDSTAVTPRLGPFNDYFIGAESVPFTANGYAEMNNESNAGATTEAGELLTCDGHPFGATVWYKLVVTVPTRVTVETGYNSLLDTVISVYTGSSIASLSRVGCNDDDYTGTTDSRLQFAAQPGVNYWVQVGGYNSQEAQFDLWFDYMTIGPDNDDFADARGTLVSQTQGTSGATTEPGEPLTCGNSSMGATVWYVLARVEPTLVTVDTRGSNFDTVLAVYRGDSLTSLNMVDCDDDISASDYDSEVTFTAQPGFTRIQVGGYPTTGGALTGNLVLNVTYQAGTGYFCRGRPATHVGTDGSEVIAGTEGNDVIVALGGNDVIYAYGGKDFICAGPGRDEVYGGPGNDRILGDAGDDELHGGSGNDRIFGRAGDDVIFGELGDDRLKGNAGYDTLRGDAGYDTCLMGEDMICEWELGGWG